MTSPLYSELPQELLLDVEPMRPAAEEEEEEVTQTESSRSALFLRNTEVFLRRAEAHRDTHDYNLSDPVL